MVPVKPAGESASLRGLIHPRRLADSPTGLESRLTPRAPHCTLSSISRHLPTKEHPMIRRAFLASVLICALAAAARAEDKQIKVLIITGDHGHAWKETTPFIKDFLTKAGMKVDVTETPSKDLTDDKLARYD